VVRCAATSCAGFSSRMQPWKLIREHSCARASCWINRGVIAGFMTDKEFDIITFDCYGTLIDWESGIVDAFKSEAARERKVLEAGHIIDAYMSEELQVESNAYKPYRDVLAETESRVAARIGLNIATERAGFLAASLPDWQPFPDANPALIRLGRRFELGILSNIDDDPLAATRRHFDVDFRLVVTAEQVRSYKPGEAHFERALARIAGKRILHAAQSYFHDVIPATRLGIPVAWVNRHGGIIEEGGRRPTYEVRNLTELANLLGP
jgi:2-haloalkanoic acid dehalogenase type II